jgi:CubicO group peptidase (beta-lactamase class C family)
MHRLPALRAIARVAPRLAALITAPRVTPLVALTSARLVILPVVLSVLLVGASRVANAQHIIGARDARALRADSVFQRFDRTDAPGCALGVYQDGKVLYARGYGMASLQNGIALSPRSVLDVGSISKQFTAMAILLLQQEGKLSLDDPIRKYIPEMPAYADKVTLRRALSQTSGLRDLYVMWGQTGRAFAGDTIDALRVITRSAEPNYEPGARYLYTNSGWILAAQIVYRLTGKTLAQFAEERIFRPLGMYDTRYLADASMVIPNLADSYAPRAGGGFRLARSAYDGAIMGAGAVQTTVEDFGRWLNNYDAATIGGRQILETMTTATTLNDGSPATSGANTAYACRAERRHAARVARDFARRELGGFPRPLPALPRTALCSRDLLQLLDFRSRFAGAQGGGDLSRRPDATRQRGHVDRIASRGAAPRAPGGEPAEPGGRVAQRRARRGATHASLG